MSRTILDIAIEAAERDATAPAPTTLFDTNNRVARILRTAAKDTLREYLTKTRWQGMSEVQSVWALALQPGRYAYPLPPDFLRVIPRTEQRNGWELGLIGPASPETWARWMSGVSGPSACPMGWRIKNNILFISPTPTSEELVTFEYISRYPVVSEIKEGDYNMATNPITTFAPVVPRDGFLDVGDSGILDKLSGGESLEYGDDEGYDVGVYGSDPLAILKWINPASRDDPLPMVRRPEFTSDTDIPAFEDDHLLSLGMTFRLRRGLSKSYAEHAAEYEREMNVKIAEDAGGARDFTIGGKDYHSGAIPMGNGNWIVS